MDLDSKRQKSKNDIIDPDQFSIFGMTKHRGRRLKYWTGSGRTCHGGFDSMTIPVADEEACDSVVRTGNLLLIPSRLPAQVDWDVDSVMAVLIT